MKNSPTFRFENAGESYFKTSGKCLDVYKRQEQRGKNAAPGDSPKNEEVGALPTPPSKTILIAEDTESNCILIIAILGRLYRLKHAKDVMEAVTMFEDCLLYTATAALG